MREGGGEGRREEEAGEGEGEERRWERGIPKFYQQIYSQMPIVW